MKYYGSQNDRKHQKRKKRYIFPSHLCSPRVNIKKLCSVSINISIFNRIKEIQIMQTSKIFFHKEWSRFFCNADFGLYDIHFWLLFFFFLQMSKKIEELEKAALGEKPWQLSGEVTAQARPENSMLEEDVEFDQTSRMGTWLLVHIHSVRLN